MSLFMKILKNTISTPTVSWNGAFGAIESNCPSGVEIILEFFRNFHEHSDGTVHTLDGTQ